MVSYQFMSVKSCGGQQLNSRRCINSAGLEAEVIGQRDLAALVVYVLEPPEPSATWLLRAVLLIIVQKESC